LDEADVLLDPLFRDQVESLWSACTSPDLRITLWSATMGASIEDFAVEQFGKLGHRGRVPIIRLVVGLKDTALPTLTHTMTYTGTEAGKLLALRQLLHPTAPDTDSEGRKSLRPPFLVFTQTIERAKALQAELRYDIPPEAGGSARMAALHSEMSEKAREKVMAEFRKGEIWVIITTDLLARGVDFRGLNGVVNYDVPTSAAAYVHRVGRTGRAGREGGVAVTFYTKDDIPYVKPIANVITASEKLRAAEGRAVEGQQDLQQWMLEALPTPTKREKKELKKQGVEARRKGAKSAMITTKNGYERKQNSKKRDMRSAAKGANAQPVGSRVAQDDDFAGFSD
jgi:ATP-dependent RNA helicase DDX52/ROK1